MIVLDLNIDSAQGFRRRPRQNLSGCVEYPGMAGAEKFLFFGNPFDKTTQMRACRIKSNDSSIQIDDNNGR